MNLAAYAKALESGLHGALTLGTTALGYSGAIQPSWAMGITTLFAVLGTFRVWLAKNAPLLEETARDIASSANAFGDLMAQEQNAVAHAGKP